MSNTLVGLLTLRLPSLGWVFLASSLRLRFPFYLGPLSSVYLLVATQGLAAYSCFTTQSFWYSLKDLLAELSASISSLVVSLYSEFMSTFCSTPSPSVLENWVFSSFFFFFFSLARFHFSVSYSASVRGNVAICYSRQSLATRV